MIRLSEKAIYSDYTPIEINSAVSIIHTNFTKFNASSLKTEIMNNSKFLDGTLKSKDIIYNGGYAGIINYTVIIQYINEINFNSYSNEYLFKVIQKKNDGY
jgi:hypothetical protein